MEIRVQHRFQNITCQAGQAAPKVYLPRGHFHLPPPLVVGRLNENLVEVRPTRPVRTAFEIIIISNVKFLKKNIAKLSGHHLQNRQFSR